MTTLRVLLAGAPAAGRADAWALFDAAGTVTRTGAGDPPTWPDADRVEAVITASRVRLATLTLPPLPASRVASAAAYAIEDQLAGPIDAQHLAASAQGPDGRVRIVVVERAVVGALAAPGARSFARVIAESELAVPAAGWRWCAASAVEGGFVRQADGSAFPVDPVPPDGALPAELAFALARPGAAPPEVRVDAPCEPDAAARWQRETGVAFVRGSPWRWHDAPAAAFAGATDLLQGAFAARPPAARGLARRVFAPALWLGSAALALHVAATVGEWAWLNGDAWRTARAWSEIAQTAGLPPEETADARSARAALARRHATLRHAQGLPARDDALPLLARAAPALAGLPAGALKSLTYADGHWTVDLARQDADALAQLDARFRQAGTVALTATSAAGTRIRIGDR